MTYRLTLSVAKTGVAFMYHSTKKYEEALSLIEKYSKYDGVTVEMQKEAVQE